MSARAALKEKLIDVAEARIISDGHASIRARDLAAEAGCAVGAIYNIYSDLSELVMEVNGRTFRKLGAHVAQAIHDSGKTDPLDQMVVMGHAYLDFASRNTNAWRTVFDLEMSSEAVVPSWYLDEMRKLFAMIAGPLSQQHPEMDYGETMLVTRALFSSVHGIVLLGLEERISAVPVDSMGKMIEIIVRKSAA